MKFNTFNAPAYPVDIKEWGCVRRNDETGEDIHYDKCFVRALTVKEYAEFVKIVSAREPDGSDISMAKVAMRLALEDGEVGKPLFHPSDLEDIANNDNRPARRIAEKLWEINSVTKSEAEALEKN